MVKVWDVGTGKCVRTLAAHTGPVTCVALGDSMMVTGGEDRVVRVYRFAEEEGEGAMEAEVVGRGEGEEEEDGYGSG